MRASPFEPERRGRRRRPPRGPTYQPRRDSDPRRGEAEQPGPDHDASAVAGHRLRSYERAASEPRSRRGPAVRSAAVTSGMDVSTHPVPRRRSATGPPQTPPRSTTLSLVAPPGTSARARPSSAVGFHLVALALFHRARRRPVVARLVGTPLVSAHVRLRRSRAGGLVHGLARLGHRPSAQPVLLGRRQRPPRRQPVVEYVGARWSASCWLRSPGSSARSPPPTSR